MRKPHLHIAIPAMDELAYLPETLHSIANQTITPVDYSVYVCVNQPEIWWEDAVKHSICEENQQLLHLLRKETRFPLYILDCSSRGLGWKGKKWGVGWARKYLFDYIFSVASSEDLIVSLDADTQISPHYFQTVIDAFQTNPKWIALSVPYYHPLTSNMDIDLAVLRYEIYMRNYAINLLRIGSPYGFTALGSAIVAIVGALKKIGGITPLKSGEDFYLLQKLRKMGTIGLWIDALVYPAARYSDRVGFGTGPAILKGVKGNWESYPIYHHSFFSPIADTYDIIGELYEKDFSTEFIQFLQMQYKEERFWQPLRRNAKEAMQFKRAFHEKADGLKILQFLKYQQRKKNITDWQSLCENLTLFCHEINTNDVLFSLHPIDERTFTSLSELSYIRDLLFKIEQYWRKKTD